MSLYHRNLRFVTGYSFESELFGIDEPQFVDTCTNHKSLKEAIAFSKQLPKDTTSVNRIGRAEDFMGLYAGVRIEHAAPDWPEVIWSEDMEGCNVELELMHILLAPLTTL